MLYLNAVDEFIFFFFWNNKVMELPAHHLFLELQNNYFPTQYLRMKKFISETKFTRYVFQFQNAGGLVFRSSLQLIFPGMFSSRSYPRQKSKLSSTGNFLRFLNNLRIWIYCDLKKHLPNTRSSFLYFFLFLLKSFCS